MILPPPGLDPFLSVPQRLEPVRIETLSSQGRIERFHMRVVRRRARSGDVDGDRVVRGPEVDQLTAALTPVVTEAPRRRASLDVEPIQHRDDAGPPHWPPTRASTHQGR